MDGKPSTKEKTMTTIRSASTPNPKTEVHHKKDGLLVVKPDGTGGYMSIWQSLAYRLGLYRP